MDADGWGGDEVVFIFVQGLGGYFAGVMVVVMSATAPTAPVSVVTARVMLGGQDEERWEFRWFPGHAESSEGVREDDCSKQDAEDEEDVEGGRDVAGRCGEGEIGAY